MSSMKRCTLCSAVAVVTVMSLNHTTAVAQGKKGGGGSTTLTNPAFVYHDVNDGGLFLIKRDGSVKVRLTSSAGSKNISPAWSPDMNSATPGHQGSIAFFRPYDTATVFGDIMAVPSGGSGPATVLRSYVDFSVPPPDMENGAVSLSWSPDGSRIVYSSGGSIWALTVATGDVDMVLESGSFPSDGVYGSFHHPCFSPDFNPDIPGYQGSVAFTLYGNAPVEGGNGADIGLAGVTIDTEGNLTATGGWTLLTNSIDWMESWPVWSPNGDYLVWTVMPANPEPLGAGRRIDIFHLTSDISWPVASTYMFDIRATWSPDNQFIAFSDSRPVAGKSTTDIFYVDVLGLDAPVNVTRTDSSRALEVSPSWNPSWVNDLP